jgi:uncharacterized membrane protein
MQNVFVGLLAVSLATFLLIPGVLCQSEFQKVEIELHPKGKALVKNLFYIDSTNTPSLSLPAYSPERIKVYDSFSDLSYTLYKGNINVDLGRRVDGYSFTIEYETDSLTFKNASTWTFAYFFPRHENLYGELSLVLPPGTKLLDSSPKGSMYTSENRITVEFALPKGEESISVKAEYTFDALEAEAYNLISIYILLALVTALAVVTLLMLRRPAKKKRIEHSHKVIKKILSVNEEKIMEELLREGEITQKKLMMRTAIPKATLSRTLRIMERKNMVELKSYGTTKLVRLSEILRKGKK